MGGRRLVVLGAVAMWAAAVAVDVSSSTVHAGAAQQASADRKLWDGVYTAAQAARGKPRFEASCSRCHNNELVGSERGPTLKGNAFWNKYENDSLGSLFTLIRDTMPRDGGAGVVSDEVKVDILAYILSRNDVPAGSDELKLAANALEAIKITKKGVLDGVYTTAQAERGKSNFLSGRCGGCHQLDLSGDRGPALKGDGFLSHWENGSVNALFKKISETMPPNGPNETTDEAKIDIVAFLLQSNGFPVGKDRAEARCRRARGDRDRAQGRHGRGPEFFAGAGRRLPDAGAEQLVDADAHDRAGGDTAGAAQRVAAEGCGGQAARRADVSAGERHTVQARRRTRARRWKRAASCTRMPATRCSI